jgi:hypothetical protein
MIIWGKKKLESLIKSIICLGYYALKSIALGLRLIGCRETLPQPSFNTGRQETSKGVTNTDDDEAINISPASINFAEAYVYWARLEAYGT